MKFDTVLFDLDGTLTDPKEGITRSVAYALDSFSVHVEDTDTLTPFIGPPLIDSFMSFYGFSRADAEKAVVKYRERFSTVGLFENKVYEGIKELLAALKANGCRVIVATSKPTVFSRRILDKFGLSCYIDFLAGSELDHSRTGKADVIAYAEEAAPIKDKSGAVMVGDRKFDIEGGKLRGMATVGVLYGYGDRAELEAAGADFIAETVASLSAYLLG